jgi:hypothetical protein
VLYPTLNANRTERKRKKKNLMVNGYRCLLREREREREREEVSKKKERLGRV